MDLPVEFIEVLSRAAGRARNHAIELKSAHEYEGTGTVGKIVRAGVEQSYMDAAVLRDFVERYNKKETEGMK